MSNQAFQELFERYLNDSISNEEYRVLMQFIDQGNQDDYIKEVIQDSFEKHATLKELGSEKQEKILAHILSKHRGDTKLIKLKKGRKNQTFRRQYLLYAAASVAFLLLVGSVFFNRIENPVTNTVPVAEMSSPVEYKGKQYIHLPDGSTVTLNENSTLTYLASAFNDSLREVNLTGEGYFDIAHNADKPFIVNTGGIATKVLGTAFNIKAYANTTQVEVTVTRGKVQVGDEKTTYGIITPNQQLKVNTNTYAFERIDIKAKEVVAWKENYLIIDDLDLQEAVALISKKYNTSIVLKDSNLKNCHITATFLSDENLDHILKVICSVIDATYSYQDDNIISITGAGCQA